MPEMNAGWFRTAGSDTWARSVLEHPTLAGYSLRSTSSIRHPGRDRGADLGVLDLEDASGVEKPTPEAAPAPVGGWMVSRKCRTSPGWSRPSPHWWPRSGASKAEPFG